MKFVVLVGHRVKIKENENMGFAGEQKKNWNIKVTVILNVIWALGTVHKNFEKTRGELDIRERIESVQTTAFLRTIILVRRVL